MMEKKNRLPGRNLRRFVTLALLLVFCFAAVCARASMLLPDMTPLETPETEGVLRVGRVLPLSDGSLVIGGQMQYPEEYRQPYRTDYEDPREKIRNDAIAMRINPGGEVLWTIRLGDPQANNFLSPMGLLPDGRILMSFYAEDSSFGDRYFIVGLDGVAEEMLPWRTLAAHFSPRSMTLMPESGYLGGDSSVVDFYYDSHTGRLEKAGVQFSREMALLDFDLNEVWRVDFSELGPWVGNKNAFEVSDGIMLLGSESTFDQVGKPTQYFTSIVKLDKKTGEILWQITDEPRRDGFFGASWLLETQDGAMLITGAYLEEGSTYPKDGWVTTLTKITSDGVPVWTKHYEHMGFTALFEIMPFEKGYVIMGIRESDLGGYTLLYVDAEGEPLGTMVFDFNQGTNGLASWILLTMTAAADGTVYVSGPAVQLYDPVKQTGGGITGSFLGVLKEEFFTMIE